MSVRRNATKKLLSAQSLGSSFQTDATVINFQDNIGYLISCTGITANTGTFTPQVRTLDSGWFDLTLDTPAVLSNADVNIEINLNQIPHEEVRLKFTDSGGDGVCDIYVCGKGLGG